MSIWTCVRSSINPLLKLINHSSIISCLQPSTQTISSNPSSFSFKYGVIHTFIHQSICLLVTVHPSTHWKLLYCFVIVHFLLLMWISLPFAVSYHLKHRNVISSVLNRVVLDEWVQAISTTLRLPVQVKEEKLVTKQIVCTSNSWIYLFL